MEVIFSNGLRAIYSRTGINKAQFDIVECRSEPLLVGSMLRVSMPNRTDPTDPFLVQTLFLNAAARLCVIAEPLLAVNNRLEDAVILRPSGHLDDLIVFPLYNKQTNRWMVDFHIPIIGGETTTQTWGPQIEAAGEWSAVVGNALAWPGIAIMILNGEDKDALGDYIMSPLSNTVADLYHPILSPILDKAPPEVKNYTGGYEDILSKAKEKDAH